MKDFGKHILLDLYGVNEEILKNESQLEEILTQAALEAKATILHTYFHKFGGAGGVTGLIALSESHISIHTWPESKYAAIDIYMCGNSSPEKAMYYIKDILKPTRSELKKIIRGN